LVAIVLVAFPSAASALQREDGRNGSSSANRQTHASLTRKVLAVRTAAAKPKPKGDSSQAGPKAGSAAGAAGGTTATSGVSYTQINGHDKNGDTITLLADQRNVCVYGNTQRDVDIAIPFTVRTFKPVDANGYPASGNALFDRRGTVTMDVWDVDDHDASGLPTYAEADQVFLGSAGTNANPYPDLMGQLTGADSQPSTNHFNFWTDRIKPTSSVNPTGINYLNVDVDTNNQGAAYAKWCVAVNKVVIRLVRTPIPVLMLHGFAVTSSKMQSLKRHYETYDALVGSIATPDLSLFGGMVMRYPQVKIAADNLLEQTGQTHLNIVAHSFGGIAARYYALHHPDVVDKIVMLGTPNGGSNLADFECDRMDGPWWKRAGASYFGAVRTYVESKVGPCEPGWAIYQMQERQMQPYDRDHPDPTGPHYYTYAGDHDDDGTNFGHARAAKLWPDVNDTWVTLKSAYYLRPGPAAYVGVPDPPDVPGHEIPQLTYDLYHEQLHEDSRPLEDTLCKLYPEACEILPTAKLRRVQAHRKPPRATTARAGGAREALLNIAQGTRQDAALTDLQLDPGASTDVPLSFEGSPSATVLVISDHPDDLSGSFGGTPLDLGEFSPGLNVLGIDLVAPADGPFHLTNNGTSVASIRVSTSIETSRKLSVAPNPALARPGAAVTFTVTMDGALPGDAPHLVVADESDNIATELDPTQSGSGTWTGTWTPPSAGSYKVRASVGGAAAREAEAEFTVASGAATVASGFTEQTVDNDQDGLTDALLVKPNVNATVAGDYIVTAELANASGTRVAAASAAVTLAVGAQAVTLSFDGRSIYDSGISGPYHVVRVNVSRNDDALHEEDSVADLGQTAAYSVGSFEHDRVTLTPDSFTDTGIDSDGNGLFDELRVTAQVQVEAAGTYSVSAELEAADGTTVALVAGNVSLSVGTNTVTLGFSGTDIGRAGKAGPYTLSGFDVVSAGDSRVDGALEAGYKTAAYTFAQFAGPDVTGTIAVDGATTTVTLPSATQYGRITFSGTGGQSVALTLSASSISSGFVQIRSPVGAVLGSGSFDSSGGQLDALVLPTTGTYTIVVDPASAGSVTLKLSSVPAEVTGTITAGGSPVTITTTTANQNAHLTFTGGLNQRISVKLASTAITAGSLSLIAPDGRTVLDTEPILASGGFLDAQTLTAPGTYTIAIDPAGTLKGSSTVNLYNVPADATAAMKNNSGTVSTTIPGQNARITFSGSAGQKATFKLTSTAITSGLMSLLRPDGSVQAAATITSTGAFIDVQTLAVRGTYTILIDPFGPATGSATVTLGNPADVTGTITAGGAAVTKSTTSPGQNVRLTFTGSVNQRVSVKDTTASGITSGTVSLLKPDGSTLASTPIASPAAYLVDVTLPVAGTYTILVDPDGSQTGSTTVTLYNVTDVTGTITPGGAAVPVSITIPGQNAKLTFSGGPGQRVSVTLTSSTLAQATVKLVNPDATTLASTTIGTSGGSIPIQELVQSGTYSVVVDPSGANTGNVTVTLGAGPSDVTGTITAGGPAVPVTISTADQNARLTFTGTAGQRVAVASSNSTISFATLSIRDSNWNPLSSASIGSGSGFLDTTTLPANGTYTVYLDPSFSYTGSVNLQLYNVPADTTGTIVAGGAAVTVTTTAPGQNAKLTFTGVQNQRVSLRLTNDSIGSGYGCQASLTIAKPSGSQPPLAQNGCIQPPAPPFFDTMQLPESGTYTITVDPTDAATGSLTLQLYDVPADTTRTIVAGGAAVTVTTTVPGQNAKLTFSGVQNQRVSLKLTNDSIGSGYGCQASLTIAKPSGAQPPLAQNGCIQPPAPPFIDTMQLPENGTYTITVDPTDAATGSLTLQLYDVPADTTGTITPGGPAVTVTTSTPGQNATLTFSGVQNELVSLRLTNDSIGSGYGCQASLTIAKPSGSQPPLAQSGCIQPPAPPFFDTMQLPETGTYTITVDPTDAATGSLTLQLYDVPPDTTGTITPGGGPVTVTIGTPGQNGKLTFSAASGQFTLAESSVTLGSSACCSGKVSVVAGQTTELNPTYFGTFGASQTFSVTVGGTQTIVIDPQDDATGSVTFTLTQNGALLAFAPAATVRWLEALSPQSASGRRPH
jgi:pimeloyl-ACP methyl ester carboxylesterase